MGKNIALISRRKQVIEFFTLEARLWGHSVYVSPVLPERLENTDILICDGVIPVSVSDDITVYRLGNGDTEGGKVLELPLSLKELKAIFGEGGGADDCRSSEDIIYMRDDSREILYKNNFYTLTELEYRLLERLGEGSGNSVVPREELMALFGAEKGNIADVYVSRLRKKLEDPSCPRIIETVRGKGYKIRVKIKKYT